MDEIIRKSQLGDSGVPQPKTERVVPSTENIPDTNKEYYCVSFANKESHPTDRRSIFKTTKFLDFILSDGLSDSRFDDFSKNDKALIISWLHLARNNLYSSENALSNFMNFKFEYELPLTTKFENEVKEFNIPKRKDTIFAVLGYSDDCEDAVRIAQKSGESNEWTTAIAQNGYWTPFHIRKNLIPDTMQQIDEDMQNVMKYRYTKKEKDDSSFNERHQSKLELVKKEKEEQNRINKEAEEAGVDLTLGETAEGDEGHASNIISIEVLNGDSSETDDEDNNSTNNMDNEF